MILKVKDAKEKLITIIQVSVIEYDYEARKSITVFDITGDRATIIPDLSSDLDWIINRSYIDKCVEIDGEVVWE